MAEVGVLNLKIKADTTEAESGLDRIIGVLRAFKTEVSNANLGSVANALKRITKVINESVNDTTISRLQQMTDALAKLKGLENISINLRYSEQISRAAEGLQNAIETANTAPQRNVDNGFSNAKDSIEEMKNNLDDMNASVEDTKGSYEYIQDEIRTAVDLESEWLKNARELNQVYADRYRALPQRSIEDMFNGMYWKRNDDGSYSKYQRENDMMSNWLRGNGTQNEFLSGVGVIANKFDMSIADVKKKLEELMRPITKVRNEIQNLFDTLNQPVKFNWSEGIDRMMNIGGPSLNARESYSAFFDAMQNGTGPLADQLRDLNPELAQDAQQFNTFEDAVSGIKDTADEATGELEDLDNELKNKKKDANEAGSAFERFCAFITELKERINDATKPVQRFGNEIWRTIRRMAIRAAIRAIVGDVKEAVENVYHYSAVIGSSFAPSMDAAAQSLQVMKNSIGAMLAPLIQSLLPVLQTVVGWFTELVNYANQFFALLNGQKTWTRAVPTTVKAFDDQKKSANGAAAAIKDLLADWDELNIIQSNTTGGGSGSSTQADTDYLSMFEEVGEYDNWIKDLLSWVEDHLEIIHGLAAGILAALAGLPASIAIGVGFLVAGIETGYNAGYDIGKNGITLDKVGKLLGGALEGALGGALIGWWIGGPAGALIGASVGIGVVAVSSIAGYEQGRLDALYGDLHAEVDDVRKAIRRAYQIRVTPEIELLHAKITGLDELKKTVRQDIEELNLARIIAQNSRYDKEDAESLARKTKELVQHTQELITGMKEYNIYIDTLINPDAKIASSNNGSDGWNTLSGIVEDIGNKIGNILSDGVVDEFEAQTLPKLLNSISNISSAITDAQNSAKYSNQAFDIRDAFLNGELDRESFNTYIDEMEKLNEETYKSAKDAVDQKIENIASLKAALEAALLEGYEEITYKGITYKVKEELDKVKEEYDRYFDPKEGDQNRRAEIEKLYKSWVTQETIDLEKTDFIKGVDAVLEKAKDTKKKIESALRGNDIYKIWHDYGEIAKDRIEHVLIDTVNKLTGIDREDLIKAQDLFGVTGWDLLTDQLKNDFINGMKNVGVDFQSTISMLKDYYSIDADEVIGFIHWDSLSDEVKEEYVSVLGKLFGSTEVQQALKKYGIDISDDLWETIFKVPEDYDGNVDFPSKPVISIDKLNEEQLTDENGKPLTDIEALELPVGIKPSLVMTIDELKNYVRDQVLEALRNDNLFTEEERRQIIESCGIDEDFMRTVTDEITPYLTNGGYAPWTKNTSKLNPNNVLAAGAVSDVGGMGYASLTTSNTAEQNTQDQNNVEVGVKRGMKEANQGSEELLRSLLTQMQLLNQKKWTVNITPTANAGGFFAKANTLYNMVTGKP